MLKGNLQGRDSRQSLPKTAPCDECLQVRVGQTSRSFVCRIECTGILGLVKVGSVGLRELSCHRPKRH